MAPPAGLRQALLDRHGRPLLDLRLSVTDRCNFRCIHCMPREVFGVNFPFLPHGEILSFEEITRLVRIARELGVRKVRLTGGEPLLRSQVCRLVGMVTGLGGVEVAMTTNGSLLAELAAPLAEAGLARLNVSLDSLDEAVFAAINATTVSPARVLAGIAAATAAGFVSLHINCVVRRGVNEESIVPLAEHFRGSGHVLRFIEYMDVGTTNSWRLADVVPASEILARLDAVYPLEALPSARFAQVAERWRYRDGAGEVGIIASVTRPFCGDCSRLRITAEGRLVSCLFGAPGTDLRALLRGGASDEEIAARLTATWQDRDDRYSELRARAAGEPRSQANRVEMSRLGG